MTEEELKSLLDSSKKTLAAVESHQKTTGEQYATIDGVLKNLEKFREETEAKIKTFDAQLRLRPEAVLPGGTDETKDNPVNIVRAIYDRNSKDHSFVKEYSNKRRDLLAGELGGVIGRDMSASDDAQGGYLIASTFLPGYVEKARQHSVIWAGAGLTTYEGVVGAPVILPIETGDPVIQSVSETGAPTATDDTVGQVVFQPHRLATLVKFSNRLLRNSALAETVVRNAIQIRVGTKMDRLIMRGTGAGNECLGLANQPGINHVAIGTNGGYATFQVAQAMVIVIEEANLANGPQKYVGHPRFFNSMKTERIATFSGDTQGFYVILPMSDQMLRDSLGYDFLKTTAIPKDLTKGTGTGLTEGYFGNWALGHLALWEDLMFRTSNEAGDSTGSAFTQSQQWLLAELEYDFQVPQPQGFSYVNDALSS